MGDVTTTLEFSIGADLPGSPIKPTVGLGMPITARFLREIVKNYITAMNPKPQDMMAGTFGKESILHILSQEECDGIRWVLAKLNGDLTVALFGVDKNGGPLPTGKSPHPLLSTDAHADTDPVVYEVSGGVTVGQVAGETGITLPLSPADTDKLVKGLIFGAHR